MKVRFCGTCKWSKSVDENRSAESPAVVMSAKSMDEHVQLCVPDEHNSCGRHRNLVTIP